jgi:Tfp pilus assembly protein FimT
VASQRNQPIPWGTRRRASPAIAFSATRPAFTLLEVVATIAFAALLAAVAIPRTMRLVDGLVVRAAVDAVAGACALARGAAIMRGTPVVVTIDTTRPAVRVTSDSDTLLDRPLDPGGPLTLSASRDRVVYSPTGLGYGASNTTVVARRRSAADTLFTSRLGRVRH